MGGTLRIMGSHDGWDTQDDGGHMMVGTLRMMGTHEVGTLKMMGVT